MTLRSQQLILRHRVDREPKAFDFRCKLNEFFLFQADLPQLPFGVPQDSRRRVDKSCMGFVIFGETTGRVQQQPSGAYLMVQGVGDCDSSMLPSDKRIPTQRRYNRWGREL